MKNRKGLVPFFSVIIIAIIAGSLVAVAWWYSNEKEQRDALANTAGQYLNTVQNANTATNSNTNSSVNTNMANTNQATNTNTAVANTNTTTNTNTSTTSDMSDLTPNCPTWQTYTDPEYSWTMEYPCNWTYERVYTATGNDPFVTYPERYVKFMNPTDEYRLVVGIMQDGDAGSTINRTGVGAGDWDDQPSITVAGETVPVRHLVFEDKLKEVFFHVAGPVNIDGYLVTATFEANQDVLTYGDIDLEGMTELEIGTAIFQSLTLP